MDVLEPDLEEEEKFDERPRIEKLCNALVLGARQGKVKGWHRCTLWRRNVQYLNKIRAV